MYTFEGAFFLFGAKKNHVEKKKYYKKIRKKVLRLKKKMQDLGYYQNQSFYPSPMMDAGDRTLTQPFVTSNTNMTPNSQIPQIPNSQLQQIDAIPLQTTLPTPTPTLNEQTSAVSSSSTKLSSGIIAFIVIVSILLVGLIVGVVILFLTKRNKNDNPPDTGAQGPKGAQGLIGAPGTAGPTGSPGARGSQGFQGPVATTNVLGIPFVFQCSTQNVTGANMVFNSFPGSTSASYTGSYQRVGNVVTVTCSNINCVITSSLPTPTYAFRVEMPISVFAVLSFAGVGNANRASGTTSFVQLEELIGTSSTTLTLRYGTPAEPIGGFRPLYETSFTIVYQTLVP